MRASDTTRFAIILCLLAACSAPAPAFRAAGHAGTIVAVRTPVPAPDLLHRLAVQPPDAQVAGWREFILRDADGRIISVVQQDDAALRVGRRARLTSAVPARLAIDD